MSYIYIRIATLSVYTPGADGPMSMLNPPRSEDVSGRPLSHGPDPFLSTLLGASVEMFFSKKSLGVVVDVGFLVDDDDDVDVDDDDYYCVDDDESY